MKLEYYGHSFWRIIANNIKVVIDPFDEIGYPIPLNLAADYIIISHDHHDHNNTSIIKGSPVILRNPGVYNFTNLTVQLFPAFHDNEQGKKRGKNNIIKLETDNLTVVHCGDLGHIPDFLDDLKHPDILMIPVGEIYTLSLADVNTIIARLEPRITIPMHYQTPELGFKLNSLDAFLNDKTNIKYNNGNILELDSGLLTEPKIMVMNCPAKGLANEKEN